jgi:hypothetical protein
MGASQHNLASKSAGAGVDQVFADLASCCFASLLRGNQKVQKLIPDCH